MKSSKNLKYSTSREFKVPLKLVIMENIKTNKMK